MLKHQWDLRVLVVEGLVRVFQKGMRAAPPAASEEQVGRVHTAFLKSSPARGHIRCASRSPRPSERTQLTPRIPPALLFSGLAFISLALEDSLSDWQGNPSQHPSCCALLPDSPSLSTEAACLG